MKVQLNIIETLFGWTMELQCPADTTPDRLDAVLLAFDGVVAGRLESSTAGRNVEGSSR